MIKNLMFYETCVKRDLMPEYTNTACLFNMQLIMHAADI